jgi:hypothetical protein
MKTIKLTSIDGDTVYFRDDRYAITAIGSGKFGSQNYTDIITNLQVFRVQESADEVAKKFGWIRDEPTQS